MRKPSSWRKKQRRKKVQTFQVAYAKTWKVFFVAGLLFADYRKFVRLRESGNKTKAIGSNVPRTLMVEQTSGLTFGDERCRMKLKVTNAFRRKDCAGEGHFLFDDENHPVQPNRINRVAVKSFRKGKRMKVGIALGGGGARGFAHIGVLRVFESAQIPIDFIAGTSAGAIVGSLYAAGKSPDEIQAIARRLRLRHWMERDRSGSGLFSTNGFRRILVSEIGRDTRIQDLPRRFCAVAVNLNSHCETVFDAGSVVDAVCASASFPGLYAPTVIDGKSYVDGGALNPVPFDIVRQRGMDIVLAVDLGADEPLFTGGNLSNRRDAWFFQLLITAEQLRIFRVVARAIGIMTRQLRIAKLKQAPPDLVIQPDAQNIGLMDFDLVEITVAAGETAARAALPQIANLLRPSFTMRWQSNWRKLFRRWRRP